MYTIYKYPFEVTDEVILAMPTGAKVLHVDLQGRTPCLWALVDVGRPVIHWVFRIYGTGHPIDTPGEHIASWQAGAFVWHMFLGGAVQKAKGGPP